MRPHRERAEAESRQQSERHPDGARTSRRSRLSRLRSEGPHPFQSFAFSVLPLCPLSLCGSLVLSSPNARSGSFVTTRSLQSPASAFRPSPAAFLADIALAWRACVTALQACEAA
jgi:hypothetical protein